MTAEVQLPHMSTKNEGLCRDEKARDVRHQNIVAAQAVADAIRTSLGPKGMDKMIQDGSGDVIITNDGVTILKQISITNPAARMMVEMSKAQDIEAGDGTTSVVVIAGSLLNAASKLLTKSIHPQTIAEGFLKASQKGAEILREIATEVALTNIASLTQAAAISLNSKVVSHNAQLLAPMAVEAVLKVADIEKSRTIDLRDIRVVKKLGGTVEDTSVVDGLVFTNQKVSRVAGGPRKIKQAKIGLIQFCLSPPKTDMENNIVIKDYRAMDRIIREERVLLATMVKKIAKTGCNVLLIQKSILRDAVTDLSLDFLAQSKILVIRDIEREDIEFVAKTLKCQPVASIDHFDETRLGTANLVEDEVLENGSRITRITGVPGKKTVTVLVRASNSLMLDEVERSFHDALCVVRSLVKINAIVAGGGACELHLAITLRQWAQTLSGSEAVCVQAYADALEVIPYCLAQNAAMNPVHVINRLKRHHLAGENSHGVDVKQGTIRDMKEENVIQPVLVSLSSLQLATETVMALLKIDDIVMTR